MNKEEIKEPIGYKFDTSINKPVLTKRCDNYYYAYPSSTGWVFYRSRYLGERDKEIIDISFDDWAHSVLDIVTEETKKLRDENTNLKQALNEIREYLLSNVDDASADFEALDVKSDILQIIDKVLGGSDDNK